MREENPQLMTVEDVAEYLRIKTSTVYEWAGNGKLRGSRSAGCGGSKGRK